MAALFGSNYSRQVEATGSSQYFGYEQQQQRPVSSQRSPQQSQSQTQPHQYHYASSHPQLQPQQPQQQIQSSMIMVNNNYPKVPPTNNGMMMNQPPPNQLVHDQVSLETSKSQPQPLAQGMMMNEPSAPPSSLSTTCPLLLNNDGTSEIAQQYPISATTTPVHSTSEEKEYSKKEQNCQGKNYQLPPSHSISNSGFQNQLIDQQPSLSTIPPSHQNHALMNNYPLPSQPSHHQPRFSQQPQTHSQPPFTFTPQSSTTSSQNPFIPQPHARPAFGYGNTSSPFGIKYSYQQQERNGIRVNSRVPTVGKMWPHCHEYSTNNLCFQLQESNSNIFGMSIIVVVEGKMNDKPPPNHTNYLVFNNQQLRLEKRSYPNDCSPSSPLSRYLLFEHCIVPYDLIQSFEVDIGGTRINGQASSTVVCVMTNGTRIQLNKEEFETVNMSTEKAHVLFQALKYCYEMIVLNQQQQQEQSQQQVQNLPTHSNSMETPSSHHER
ncbi:hypothetical protein FDP41_011353 [Naegleria fowleri]|uniref:Uncharacterized protein n=1 Tax=Naegleria fowleri TaxID=5763 RepID=A0A6A5BWF7_NAEFO|nr:uncharacterized protein FDP41_011353 [Naegleria fowleri]KAF0982423.1 hypothetical protein FDP41_011353 [Naegleria fowleri]CAG4714959.1 unnamed protein product [Naegleria fowleri]